MRKADIPDLQPGERRCWTAGGPSGPPMGGSLAWGGSQAESERGVLGTPCLPLALPLVGLVSPLGLQGVPWSGHLSGPHESKEGQPQLGDLRGGSLTQTESEGSSKLLSESATSLACLPPAAQLGGLQGPVPGAL